MRALGAVRDAARLDDVAKQAEIGEIESHGNDPAFVFGEVRLPISPIVLDYFNTILRERRNYSLRARLGICTVLHCGTPAD